MEISIPVTRLSTKQLLCRVVLPELLQIGDTVSELSDKIDAYVSESTTVVQKLKDALAASQANDASDAATIKALQDEVSDAISRLDKAQAGLDQAGGDSSSTPPATDGGDTAADGTPPAADTTAPAPTDGTPVDGSAADGAPSAGTDGTADPGQV